MTTHVTAPLMQDQSFESVEWKRRRIFVTFINKAARELDIDVQWLSDHWIAKLIKGNQVRYIYGSTLPLNNNASSLLTQDKVATFEALDAAHIAAVPHYLVRFTPSQLPLEAAAKGVRFAKLPIVVKPLTGRGGQDVVRVNSIDELNLLLNDFAGKYESVSLSPLVRIEHEYRLVMLDREPLIIFEKKLTDEQRAEGEWRHNLNLGAKPQVHSDPKICDPLIKFARETMAALDLHFAAIDIVQVEGELMVLEVNQGFGLNIFAAHTPMYALQAFATYRAALEKCFADVE